MEINNMYMRDISFGGLYCFVEDVYHVKSLSCLSIVQAVQRHYDIRIQNSLELNLNETDVFVAPPNKTQYIRHHNNQSLGIMKAHWIFYNVIVNDEFYLTDIYEFPIQLPSKYNQQIMDIITNFNCKTFCSQQAELFKLTDILLKTGHQKGLENSEFLRLKSYISQHIYDNEALTPARLSIYMNTSQSSFYRKFKSMFGITSVVYIRNERLDKAALLLETTDSTVGSICEKTGFYDNSQFDMFFKKRFETSPSAFRKKVKHGCNYTETPV